MLALLNWRATKTLRRFQLDIQDARFQEAAEELRLHLKETGRYGDLEALCRAVLDLQGPEASWLRDLGLSQLFLGNPSAAARKLRRARDLEPDEPAIGGYLALCYLFAGREAEAGDELLRARKIAEAEGRSLPAVADGFAYALIDEDFEMAGDRLRPYLKLRVWRRLFDQVAFAPVD